MRRSGMLRALAASIALVHSGLGELCQDPLRTCVTNDGKQPSVAGSREVFEAEDEYTAFLAISRSSIRHAPVDSVAVEHGQEQPGDDGRVEMSEQTGTVVQGKVARRMSKLLSVYEHKPVALFQLLERILDFQKSMAEGSSDESTHDVEKHRLALLTNAVESNGEGSDGLHSDDTAPHYPWDPLLDQDYVYDANNYLEDYMNGTRGNATANKSRSSVPHITGSAPAASGTTTAASSTGSSTAKATTGSPTTAAPSPAPPAKTNANKANATKTNAKTNATEANATKHSNKANGTALLWHPLLDQDYIYDANNYLESWLNRTAANANADPQKGVALLFAQCRAFSGDAKSARPIPRLAAVLTRRCLERKRLEQLRLKRLSKNVKLWLSKRKPHGV